MCWSVHVSKPPHHHGKLDMGLEDPARLTLDMGLEGPRHVPQSQARARKLLDTSWLSVSSRRSHLFQLLQHTQLGHHVVGNDA